MGEGGGFPRVRAMVSLMSLKSSVVRPNTKGAPEIELTNLMRPQIPCVTQKGSKELDLRNWLETWCRSQIPTLKGVEGSCWKLRD
jgi:hypothetical protein